jgi:rhodanese-related sulfurtransferase
MLRRGLILSVLLIVVTTGLSAQQTTDPALREYTTPSGLSRLIQEESPSYLLVDVRTPAEYAGGHIPTAINIPYQNIARDLPETEEDTILVVYCRSGRRSGIAYDTLRSTGYDRIVDFGGIVRWRGELER